ncbi:pseudouridine synthase [Gynuella sunshinyii]|uniref:pseudouridine synthase n=1 Tax=Gynuella sunshinyii TaxID=1445505 RepID=UPI0005CB9211|nr:pseudouridine synthase [Gynuella sunshinyii]
MAKIILLNKPFNVLSQFRKNDERQTLADFVKDATVNVAGRLDYDSEGLIVLTDNGLLQQQISNPKHQKWKTYWVQVEGQIGEEAILKLSRGVPLKDGMTRPAKVQNISEPDIWVRTPPVRERKSIPTSWIEISISEGRNRQIRRMTAAVGHPTLRLIRTTVGEWKLEDLLPGEYRELQVDAPKQASVNPRKKIRRLDQRPDRNRRWNSQNRKA